MSQLRLIILILSFILLSFAFDKNLMKKAKFDVSHKHPISRRVLRFERSVGGYEDNRINDDFPIPFPIPSSNDMDVKENTHYINSKDLLTLLTPFNEQDVDEDF